MTQFGRHTQEEIEALKRPKSLPNKRYEMRNKFVEFLQTLRVGEGGYVELAEGERRETARNRLRYAADKLGLELEFIQTRRDGKVHFVVIGQQPKATSQDEDELLPLPAGGHATVRQIEETTAAIVGDLQRRGRDPWRSSRR